MTRARLDGDEGPGVQWDVLPVGGYLTDLGHAGDGVRMINEADQGALRPKVAEYASVTCFMSTGFTLG